LISSKKISNFKKAMESGEKIFAKSEEPDYNFDADEEGFVRFGDVSRRFIENEQVQYTSRFLNGVGGQRPNLAKGLRIKEGPMKSYHTVRIHRDDIPEFVRRYNEYEEERKKLFSSE
jgi:hypothetical protein